MRLWFRPSTPEDHIETNPIVPANPLPGLTQVNADASRCVQCGICNYSCPVGIPVREFARRGENVTDSRCISCGACVERCPRGTLRWGPAVISRPDFTLDAASEALPTMLQLTRIRVTRT